MRLIAVNSFGHWRGKNDLSPLVDEVAAFSKAIDNKFTYLYAKQLISHILGLRKWAINNQPKRMALVYIWYDVPEEHEAREHEKECKEFEDALKRTGFMKDAGIDFVVTTHQELFNALKQMLPSHDIDNEYITYLQERYFSG